MDQAFVIGATGGIGRLVVQRLLAVRKSVVALVRRKEQAAELESWGVKTVIGDLTRASSAELAELMRGCGVAIFAAGASEQGKNVATAVDGRGVEKALEACVVSGTRRFLHVSAFPDALRGQGMSGEFEHYMAVKRAADVAIAASGLDWVIVRPGSLTDGPSGPVRLAQAVPYGSVSRASVAEVLVALVDAPLRGVVIEVTDGTSSVAASLDVLSRSISA
ncbi:SDR family oxidoreductase [Ralstonia pseudosolanacearum]|nr:hypothetical protein RSP799_12890 [Ralstonia solanacearum]